MRNERIKWNRVLNKFKPSPSNLYILVTRQVVWIIQVFRPEQSRWTKPLTTFSMKLHSIFQSNGAVAGTLFVKGVRTVLLSYLAGNPVKVSGIGSTKDGIPLVLGDLIGAIRTGVIGVIPIITTIQFATRALSLGRNLDLRSIEDASNRDTVFDGRYQKSFWKELGYSPSQVVPEGVRWKKFHFTTKNGPNGHALGTSLIDLVTLPETLIDSIGIVGGDNLLEKIRLLRSNLDIQNPGNPGRQRKISYFPDKEQKIRVIGIQDYWSQTSLRPFHLYLNRVLRKIPQDCTFDQGAFVNKMIGWTTFHSIDLTAATDRFPIRVISMVQKAKFPAKWVNAWEHIMIGTPFWSSAVKREVSYTVGNPMGAYSSWVSFALAHHFLLYHSCRIIGMRWKTAPYVLLGDDIVIGDDHLAEAYLQQISELGQEFSKEKTYSSSTFCEFAKRLVWKGTEITPFPVSGLHEVSKRYYLLDSFFVEQETKGWKVTDGAPAQVSSFYRSFFGYNSTRAKAIYEKALISDRMMKVIRGVIPVTDLVIDLANKCEFPYVNKLTEEVCTNMLSNAAVEAFAQSNPENQTKSKTGYPLGQLAIDLVCYFSGQAETRPSAIDLIYAHPILQAYGQVEEMYMNQKRQAIRVDRLGEGWPMLLRVMALPLDDRIFVERSSRLIPKAATFIGRAQKERFDILREYPNLF